MLGRIALRGVWTLTLLGCAAVATALFFGRDAVTPAAENVAFGVTFAPRELLQSGYDPYDAFAAVLDDLHVPILRFVAYWPEVEPAEGVFDFTSVDWYLNEAAKRGVQVTLVVGMKVPRWPECHIPTWVNDASRRDALLAYVSTVVTRYRAHPAVARWQVENEPYYPFGICPTADPGLLADEVALVRALDPETPVQLTVSGENEPWSALAEKADVVGASLYRFAWNPYTGLVVFPHAPAYYALQAASLGNRVDRVVISELQAEPWFADGERPTSAEERYAAFTEERLRDHLRFAQETGLPEVYLWGVEWWYALRQEGDARLWNAAKEYTCSTCAKEE